MISTALIEQEDTELWHETPSRERTDDEAEEATEEL
jgi:hypothetical protein